MTTLKSKFFSTMILATAFVSGIASAQATRLPNDGPFSEFVYEALGATPSIRFGSARKPEATPSARRDDKRGEAQARVEAKSGSQADGADASVLAQTNRK